jgi:hypothetical protein
MGQIGSGSIAKPKFWQPKKQKEKEMTRVLQFFGVVGLGALFTVVVACQSDVSTSQTAAPEPEQQSSEMAQQATEAQQGESAQLASQNLEIVGTVAKTGDEVVIMTDDGTYAVATPSRVDNLDDMGGKVVKVTAALVPGVEREDGYQVIDVIQISAME